MSKEKFTKGEWKIDKTKFSSSMCSDIPKGFAISTDEYHPFITIENYEKEESKANANLIAAAPEMYEMLDNLQRYLADEYLTTSLEIRKLLSKARGEHE